MLKLFNNFDVQPLGNFVLLQREEAKSMSDGGIHLVTNNTPQDKSMQATVLAVGPGSVVNGNTFVPTTVKVGDLVLVDKIGGFEIEINEGEVILIVREPEIIAVIRDKTK